MLMEVKLVEPQLRLVSPSAVHRFARAIASQSLAGTLGGETKPPGHAPSLTSS
jgi:hypothetical protein